MTNRPGETIGAEQSEVLTGHGLAVGAGGLRLVEGFEFTLRCGELLGVVGPSGCGKTTLLRAIAGLIDFVAGEVRLDGTLPGEHGWPNYRRRVVLVEQRPVLLDRTVQENLAAPFQYGVSRNGFPAERARALLDRLRVEPERFDQNARSLSVGQQQRVSLVRALLIDPAVMLLDEPTSALDADAVEVAEELIREEANRRGLCALVVTHDRAQAERMCGSILDLRDYAPERPDAP